jgi:tetrahydromethanopterin S-methyltransferase subunit B
MDSGQLTAVLIVAIVMIASIVRARYGYSRHGRRSTGITAEEHAENLRLRDEVKELKERLKVLERIAVDKENSLSREIESLRDR